MILEHLNATAEEKATMKKMVDEILNNSNGFKDSKSLVFPTNGLLDSNGYESSKDSLACATKEKNELWKVQQLDGSAVFEDLSRSNKDEIRASPLKDACKRNGNSFACDTEDRDHRRNIPEFEGCMVVDFIDDKETGAVVSNAPFTSALELFGTDSHLYTDKGVVERKSPESTVCYKRSNFNIIKDICMDEGIPVVDEMLTESRKDDEPGLSVSLAADKGQIDSKLLLAGESKASSVEDTGKVAVTHHKTIEDEGTNSLVPNGLKPSSEDNVSKHADKHSYVEDLMKIYGSKCTTKAEATNVSEKESSVNNRLCLEDSTVQNSKNDQSTQQLDQMPSLLATFNSQNAVLAADETNNSGPSSNFDNSKSETGAVTSGLNSTELALSNSIQNIVKNLPGRSLKDSSDSFSAASQVHFANSVESSNSSGHGQFLDPPNGANVEDKTFGNLPLDMHGHLADGEASFSAAEPGLGFITYSGPISHSGSISLRSDSSTTSTKSFAFPILQSEWNSSPARMPQTERRHLQKHRGWRQSLICCRF